MAAYRVVIASDWVRVPAVSLFQGLAMESQSVCKTVVNATVGVRIPPLGPRQGVAQFGQSEGFGSPRSEVRILPP